MAKITFPTILTLIRLIASPIVLPILLVYGLPYNIAIINVFLASLFALLALTDFFDGYLARKLKLESSLGKALDPLADKFLVYSTLIALLAINRIYFYWVVLLIGRDFFIMGLRQIALEQGFSVPVDWLGKIKTMTLLTFLTVTIAHPYDWMHNGSFYQGIETTLLFSTLVLSLWSAKNYYDTFMEKASSARTNSNEY
ncbi:CDP-diacylglycerol--glycerol-3-phosphate 3-phosphatidyltransferase [Candidatus Dependentiae bacterium]|nr:CDP-diacylglycerol--glycerol-3-phosphate 3-phosphatidyltransferase [Candidatus Dependentiae bacterium]